MTTRARGSGLTAAGLAVTMIAVGAGVSPGGSLVLLASFYGVLAGAILIFVGVRMVADDPTAPVGRFVAAGVRALVHSCLRRNLALAGLLLASAAASATAGADPVFRFCAFALLLLGLSVLNIGVLLRLGEQERAY